MLAGAPSPAWSADSAAQGDLASTYGSRIRGLLQTYCHECHNPEDAEGGIDLSQFETASSALAKKPLWRRARRRLLAHEMPPDDARQPTEAEQAELAQWMAAAVEFVDCDPARRDPGPDVLRRLTQSEYRRTARDLLFLPDTVTRAISLPDDPRGEGFENLATGLDVSPAYLDRYFTAAETLVDALSSSEGAGRESRKKLGFEGPVAVDKEQTQAEQVLSRLLRRAYRRPVATEEVPRLLELYERGRARGQSHADALTAALKPMLVSPHFLLRVEAARPHDGRPGLGMPVSGPELAARLSYFLWGSMPDEDLLRAGEEGRLLEPDELERQTRRMLADAKAETLTSVFAVQWLQLDKLLNARPSAEFFPKISQLRGPMLQEVTSYFDHLRTQDRSVLELLDSDYTFANEVLAKHYGIAGVTGDKFQKVSVQPEHHRGGLLGMGAVLTMTSHTFRTSPTLRGKYVLDVIFGDPPPPPPANAGMLQDDSPKKAGEPRTFKEKMAQHATQATCAGCHRKIDPIGFALDNYDPIGGWREGTPQAPLDVTGALPTGEQLTGVASLKQVVLQRKSEFTRNVVEKMLTYALGRELEAADDCAVREIEQSLQTSEYKFSALMLAVVRSYPFQHRAAATPPPKQKD